MKKINHSILCLLLIVFCGSNQAQTTFTTVYNIFQTKCVTACHGGSSPSGNLNLSGTQSAVYNALVNATPTNPAAQSKGYKRVDPGYNHNSYLLKKVNHGLDPDNDLGSVSEGNMMPPSGSPQLTNVEVDIISSWILAGAPQNGTVVNEQIINDYHNGLGIPQIPPPAAPDTSEGFQIHYGSIFLDKNEEVEYLKKHALTFPSQMEVTGFDGLINTQSHHFLLYRYDSLSDAAGVPNGLRKVTGFLNAFPNNATLIIAWQNSHNVVLPAGTGFFWDASIVLDLDLHIRNYSDSTILKADVYINVYARPRQAQTVEMHTDLIFYKDPPAPYPFSDFLIPNDSTNHTFTDAIFQSGATDTMHVWMLSSHTHKYGKDYDIYLRNANGSKGIQLYEGWYDFNYNFNQGFFDFHHPPIEYFDPLFAIPRKTGIIHEAVYNNTGTSSVTFGITTADEMMAIFIQYTLQEPMVGVKEVSTNEIQLNIFPNPSTDESIICFRLNDASNLSVEIIDILGKKVATVSKGKLPSGNHQLNFSAKKAGLNAGVYIVNINAGGKNHTKKLMVY